jgi:hypothetical protein
MSQQEKPKKGYRELLAEAGPHVEIPQYFFQRRNVQAKFDKMRADESINASIKQRIPERYPYSKAELMEGYLKETAEKSLPEGSYSIGMENKESHSVVYFETIPSFEVQPDPKKIRFKIHLMFNVKYMNEVLHRLFNELIKNLIEARFPVKFKLLNFNPVTAIAGRAGMPYPLFNNVTFDQGRQVSAVHYNYGTNHAKKSEYRRLAESFIYSPTEIKKYQVIAKYNYMGTPLQSSTFTLDGTLDDTKDGKDINEQYDMESVFDPVIVFYTMENPIYTRELLQNLLTIFPDDTTQKWVLPNFYPRGNVKINNMVYLANGDFNTKSNRKMQCIYRPNGPICSLNPNDGKLLNIPPEYQAIQASCSSLPPDQCNTANRFPLAVSNHKLCKLEKVGNEEQCKPQKTYTQHLLLQDYDSLEDLYDAVGQRAVLERLKAGTENASLPTNYGGRRTRRNKQSRKKNKNKSRRAH